MPPVFRVQLVSGPSVTRFEVNDSYDVAGILRRYLEHEDRKHFVTLMLDVRNRVIGIHTVSIGNLNSAIVSPREVFKAAILANASAIILGHNHPSGDITPSPEDIEVTKVISQAGRLLDLEVLDHVIIRNSGNFHSLRRDGKMPYN
jgi:DNA repair protein RadC